ncbi:hypothetical protein BDY24DRAFT_99887 [Mrakia frigida]|uniref:uncharacterized protein n=1 Tax=Mrakia frigida TaxID=29902 RepID=UPI003FCBF134
MSFIEQAAQGSERISVDPVVELNDLSPSLVPASSATSSSNPPAPSQGLQRSQDAFTMASQIAQLFSLVGQLSSENKALKAEAALHSSQLEAHLSSIALLSSENEELRRRDEEKDKTMKEMTKAFGSHWIWEAGRGEGREGKGCWLWSGVSTLSFLFSPPISTSLTSRTPHHPHRT